MVRIRKSATTCLPNITCGYATGLYRLIKLILAITVLSVVLYVFPPWRMRTALETIWTGLGYVGSFAHTISKSESHAAAVGNQMLKSGRDLWKTVKALESNSVQSLG
jgi:hypothetical protein